MTTETKDQTAGFTKSFDQYEYVAVITPGATLLFGLILVLRRDILPDDLSEISVGALGFFLIAAYVAGQFIQAIGDVLAPGTWRLFCRGMPTEWVLLEPAKSDKLIDAGQKTKLVEKLKTLPANLSEYEIKTDDRCAGRRTKFESWQAVTRRINVKIGNAKQGARIGAFNRTYGLMVGMTIVLVILALLLAGSIYAGTSRAVYGCLLLTIVLAALTAYRAYKFGVYYGRELYVTYLEIP